MLPRESFGKLFFKFLFTISFELKDLNETKCFKDFIVWIQLNGIYASLQSSALIKFA